MHNGYSLRVAAVMLAGLVGATGVGLGDAAAQKIICWKDKSGKVIGCGDRVPHEYRDAATQELDRRGVTRKVTESAEDAAKRRAQEEELARQKAEEEKRLADLRRQDAALLATYSSAEEIDQKRDRELQQLDAQMDQLQVALKNVTERANDLSARSAAMQKQKKPVPPALEEDIVKTNQEKERLERTIASREKEKQQIRNRYFADRKRYLEIKGSAAAPAVPTPPPTAAKK
ncbi:MAG: hypothetical protein FJY54_05830 [Betaproteobacteria bacterium]|nr:hypothetical protein [Betaproteobacteria bacterium]